MVQSKKVAAKKTKTLKEAAKKTPVKKKPTTKQIKEALAVGDTATLGKMMKAEVGTKGRKLVKPVADKKPSKIVRKTKDMALSAEKPKPILATITPELVEAVDVLKDTGTNVKVIRLIDEETEAKEREVFRNVRAITDEPDVDPVVIGEDFAEIVKEEVASGWSYPVYTDETGKSVGGQIEQPSLLKKIWKWFSK